MATIPRAALDFVTDEINGISADAQRKAMRVLERIDWSDVTAARELAVEAAQLALSDATTLAAQASADFYDASRELAVGEKLGARALSGYNPDATDGAIRGFVRFVERGDIEQFNDQVMQRIDYEIKRAAGYSMTENGAADPLNPRYARVPTGTETCAFCLMLASRGFVYRSERNAGSMNHYHSGCDCRVVCSWQTTGAGVSRRASLDLDVEGYDPDALYDEWIASIDEDARERAERYGTSFDDERASIMRAYRRSAEGAKRRGKYAASESGMEFDSFADVKRYVYGATSQADLEHRYSVLSGIYGARSEQMRSQSMRNAFRHMEKKLIGGIGDQRRRSIGAVYSDVYAARDAEVAKADLDRIKQTQLVHIYGTPQNRNAAESRGREPSCFTISEEEVKELIKKHAGHGEPDMLREIRWNRKENCTSDRVIGYIINDSGEKIPTRCFKIHYSNDGVHAVPRFDEGGMPDEVE